MKDIFGFGGKKRGLSVKIDVSLLVREKGFI